jgi:hypothetical protein
MDDLLGCADPNLDNIRYRRAEITFALPSESWMHLSSMPLSLRWETEALLETLTTPVKSIDWEASPEGPFDGNKMVSIAESNDSEGVALDFDLDAPEFTSKQLEMMAELNKEMNDG